MESKLFFLTCYFLILVLVIYLACVSLRQTVFGFSLKRRNVAGFFILFDYIFFVFPGTVLLLCYPSSSFWVAFRVNDEISDLVGLLINIEIFLFYFTLYLISIRVKAFKISNFNFPCNDIKQFEKLLDIMLIYCFALMFLAYTQLGSEHAYFSRYFGGNALYEIRSYHEKEFFSKMIKFSFAIVITIQAFLLANSKSLTIANKIIKIALILVIGAWGGDKSTVMYPFIGYLLGYATANQIKAKNLFAITLLVLISIPFLIYPAVVLQYAHLHGASDFIEYLYQRILIGQIVGVYEQFGIQLSSFDYIYNALPIPHDIFEPKNYHKDLMVISEQLVNPEQNGIKNTLFVAEADAIGGIILALLSGPIVALAYIAAYRLVYAFYSLFLNRGDLLKVAVSVQLFSFQRITGGFTELLLLRNIIVFIFLMLPILFFYKIIVNSRLYKKF